MSYIGSNKIAKMYLGDTAIAKAYLGDDLVFDSSGGSLTPTLPYDAEIEYLQTTGTQYIDTGIVHAERNTEMRMRFQWTGSTASNFESFFAYMAASPNVTPRSGFHKYQSKWMFGTNVTTSTGVTVDSNVHDLFWTSNASTQKEQLYLDNTKIGEGTTNSTGLSGNTITFFLGCRNRNGSIDNAASMRVMSLNYKKFTDASHTTTLQEWNFIPVRVGQTGYMYETVNGTLYGNSGSGSFTLGNDKTS